MKVEIDSKDLLVLYELSAKELINCMVNAKIDYTKGSIESHYEKFLEIYEKVKSILTDKDDLKEVIAIRNMVKKAYIKLTL